MTSRFSASNPTYLTVASRRRGRWRYSYNGKGKEIFRVESYVRTFHLQSALDYVASNAYLKEPSFQRYIQARAEAIRERGGRVDLMRQ